MPEIPKTPVDCIECSLVPSPPALGALLGVAVPPCIQLVPSQCPQVQVPSTPTPRGSQVIKWL